jgi:hypothetical protein
MCVFRCALQRIVVYCRVLSEATSSDLHITYDPNGNFEAKYRLLYRDDGHEELHHALREEGVYFRSRMLFFEEKLHTRKTLLNENVVPSGWGRCYCSA